MSGRRLSLALLIAVSACGRGLSEQPIVFDLIAGFGLADTVSETRTIDFGTLAGRRHLESGWLADDFDRQRGRNFVRGDGDTSVLAFDVIEPRPLVLRFLAGLSEDTEQEPMAVELLVNGFPVANLEIGSRIGRQRCRVPEGVLEVGRNEMSLRYPAVDGAALRPAWYELEFRYAGEAVPPEPSLLEAGAAVMIPFGTRLEYYLELPPKASLVIDDLQFVGPAGGQLHAFVDRDERPPTELALVSAGETRVEVPLPTDEPRIVRLTLSAEHPETDLSGRAGVRLASAAIRATPPVDVIHEGPAATASGWIGGHPNIVLYVVDTLRADHLGIYGYPKPVSPHLDRFAESATVFDHAIGQSSWTRASMASIFTGLWPVKHATNGRKDILDPAALTLPEILEQAGYQTEALVRNWNVFPIFGFRQGFAEFRGIREGKADRVNRFVEEFLASRDRSRPFFLWVHTVDPHEPYRPPPATRERFLEPDQERFDLDKHPSFKATDAMPASERRRVAAYLSALYDAEISFNDRGFGDLVDMLAAEDLLDSTLILFVSDHGEEFLDHGTWGHGRNLYAETIDVPLVIRFPDRGQGTRVRETVQHVDLLPTILDYVGLEIPPTAEGRSLLPLVDGVGESAGFASRPVFSYLHLDGAPNRGLIDGGWKLVQRLDEMGQPNWTALFDRQADPEDSRDESLRLPVQTRYMELLLDAKMQEGSLLTTEEAVLDAETERALKALGYLQ